MRVNIHISGPYPMGTMVLEELTGETVDDLMDNIYDFSLNTDTRQLLKDMLLDVSKHAS